MAPPSGMSIDAILPNCAASTSEYAVASQNPPIIKPTTCATDNCVTADKPIGDRHISPTSSRKYASTSHHTLASAPSPTECAAASNGRKARAANSRPNTLFIGLLGFAPRRSSHGHNHAKNGDNTTTKNEPRNVSDPAVCGTSTTSRKHAIAMPTTSSATIARASPRLPRSLAFSAITMPIGVAAISHSDHGSVPLASLTSDGNMSFVINRSVKVSHEP